MTLTRAFCGPIHFLLTITCMSTSVLTDSGGKETLSLGVFVSQDSALDFTGFLVALDLAIDTINKNSSFLYNFTYLRNDSMCQAAPTLRSLIDQIFLPSTENQIMLIGPDCSIATEPVAELAPNWNLMQISAASTSPLLSDSEKFPLFLRTVSSDSEAVIGVKAAMRQFGWSRISLITQSENIFTFVATRFRNELTETDLKITREFTLNTVKDVPGVVNNLRNSPARIIFVNMYDQNAAEIICLAAKFGLSYPRYQWMFPDWYTDGWWNTANNCTHNESLLQNFVKYSLTYSHYPILSEEEKDTLNVGNISWNDFKSYYDDNIESYKIKNHSQLLGMQDSAFMFDAVWTAALAINRTASKLPSGVTLKNFTYNDEVSKNISRILYEEALNVTFFGLTGEVYFRENGDRPGIVTLRQYRHNDSDGGLIKEDYARVINGSLKFEENESVSTVFKDGIPQDEEYVQISSTWFIIHTAVSLLGMLFAVACLIFNLWFRDQKLVKLTSPYINVMIIAGAVIFYITVILFGVDENVASSSTVDHLCQTRIWLAAIGFSLMFGTIFAKTWRIYYIFNLARPNSKFEVKDIYLFAIVGILVLVDVAVMLPPTLLSSATLKRKEEETEGDNDDDLPQIIRVCSSDDSLVWLPILICYKGFVLLVGLFLAFETRKVKYLALNESRFIAMSVYGAVVVSIALTPIGFLLENFPTIQYAVMGMMMLLSITLILALLFIPKMYRVYHDPKGKRSLRSGKTIKQQRQTSAVNFSEDEYKRRIESLNLEIKALNEEIEMVQLMYTQIYRNSYI
ncbi:gamma-aminobutyric acid type B receptor subunit 2-like isoform X2 [Dysidea avara]|uniref:gamma-aminobutyric acid type B receptor subunit 2-like isoform X2 n=1 Tax=Dysidea avara TaxID=196820 RepID=UPI003326EF3C